MSVVSSSYHKIRPRTEASAIEGSPLSQVVAMAEAIALPFLGYD
jgi:hypothetical protein